jgi:hypothetical protein
VDNQVKIKVVADDDTDRGFASARAKVRKFGEDIADGLKKIGPKIGDTLGKDVIEGVGNKVPAMGQVGIILGAALAPTLGAAVAAGLMGAAGGVGIVGGITLAAKDPRVAAAGEGLGKELSTSLQKSASAFVPVLLSSMETIRGSFRKLLPDIQAIFDKSATFIAPLLDGLTTGAGRLIDGIRKAVEGAEPVFESFGRLFAGIGDAVGGLFEGIADDGDAAGAAIDDVTMALSNTIETIGHVVNALAELKGAQESLDEGIDKQRYKLEDNVSWLDLTADGYEKGSEAANLYREGVIGAAGSTNDYNHYLEQQADATKKATDATLAQTDALKELADEVKSQVDPLFKVIDAQEALNQKQKAYADAVKKSGRNSDEAKAALRDLGKAAFGLNGDIAAVAKDFNGEFTPSMRKALQNAGLTTGQISRLEKQLKTAARAAKAWEGTFSQTYVTNFKTFGKPYSQEGISRGSVGGLASGGIKGAASGMLGEGMTWVGENGPELVDLPPGAHVQSNPDSKRMVAGAGSGDGFSGPIIINLSVDGDVIARAALPSLQAINRTQYSGDVTRMFPATR